MAGLFESIMLICFGISWPVSVYKSLTAKSTQGKSVVFIIAILIGYIAGIIGKILGNNINYVLTIYIFNFIIVSLDLCLYFRNKKLEKEIRREHYENRTQRANQYVQGF